MPFLNRLLNQLLIWLLIWLLILFAPAVALARAPADGLAPTPSGAALSGAEVVTPHLTARLLPEQSRVVPGDQIDLLLVFDLQPGWHTYWRNPGDSGEPPRLSWTLPEGVTAGPIQWPYPSRIPVGPLANYGYFDQALHLVSLSVDPDWPAGRDIPVELDVRWLVCEEHCIPESGQFALNLATAAVASEASAMPGDPMTAVLFEQARAALPKVLPADALMDPSGDPLLLRLSREGLPAGIQELEFFADAWGLIEHAAEQPWRLRGDWLELELTPGATPASVAPSGVLVATTAEGVRAWEFSASVQPLLPLADADAPALGLPLALAFALLGGLVLNLMPCVFPVLAIKLLGLAEQRDLGRAARAWHALLYSAGVLVFFTLLGVALLVLRAAGAAAGWGFQLQSPVFVALMAGLFLVLGLGLFGAFTLGTSLMGLGGGGRLLAENAPGQVRLDRAALAAFGTGALAALVAAPCTAPFMGAALGYALTQPWFAALAVILTLGLGMALPFALLSVFPAWARSLPRPGVWMERLKQLLAFPLFATTAWLLWVLAQQSGPSGLALVLTALLALVFGLWLLETARQDGHGWRRGWSLGLRLLALASVLAALGLIIQLSPLANPAAPAAGTGQAAESSHQLSAAPYSAAALESALDQGRPVFVNMTAAWCITCLVNERVALGTAQVARAFAEREVLYLKGDWTNHDPAISAYLNAFGRDGVPLYVYYAPGAKPEVLPQLLTPGLVVDALTTTSATGL
ncbi:protein-disulfide reductase DsbD family protein [Thiorhodovibrio winogradskyi]|uniref:protein-disulfide reductase DsbD family protein n=1 Tax=Thiorhodovibrio winogradskyi TaxID=77007 RepID=UPI002E2D3E65|nr:protein-disulfide reductase DsbD domain-containing protein [Thiorhodovibrio winogradskyi]